MASKGNPNAPIDWDFEMQGDRLTREDIYRQRIFGNNSGAKDFIEVEEKRRIKSYWMYVYIFFVIATYVYTKARINVTDEYDVYEAIRRPFDTTVFTSAPQPRRWQNIDSMQDVQDWLLYAFPDIMTPDVQHFNVPLGEIRFTMRRMKMEQNDGKRFNVFNPLIWMNPNGIEPDSENEKYDDSDEFGAYRVWSNVTLDWSYRAEADKMCPAASKWIDTVEFPHDLEYVKLEMQCRQWCEQLIRPMTCHCFEQSEATFTCDFYQVLDPDGFDLASETQLYTGRRDQDQNVIIPKLQSAPKQGLSAMYPMMKKFKFQNKKQGYKKTPGYRQLLSYYSQSELNNMAVLKSVSNSTPQRVMSAEIEDWIAGGYLGANSVTLAVDFCSYNPNYQMFSWVQLLFKSTATGLVTKELRIYSVKVDKKKDLEKTWEFFTNEMSFDGLGDILGVCYMALLVLYIGCEAEVMLMSCCSSSGAKYFNSPWNWLTLIHLTTNLATVLLWVFYKGQTDFTKDLQALQSSGDGAAFTPDILESFGVTVASYRMFRACAAFNMLFLSFQMLQLMNQIVGRVGVLIETVTESFTPIFFFTCVCIVILFGAVMWTFVWFGRKVEDFSSFQEAVVTVVAMTVGEFSAFKEVKNAFGLESFGFYIPYQLFMIIVILNFPRAVLNAGYKDSSEKYEAEQKRKELQQNVESSKSGGGMFGVVQVFLKRCTNLLPTELGWKEIKENSRKYDGVKVKKASFIAYVIFCILYTIMAFLIMKTQDGYQMTRMVEDQIKLATFSKKNVITGQTVRGANFATINSRDDVQKFIREVLPAALFTRSMISGATFDGNQNQLLNYSSSPEYKQLVMQNWNILVGQKPARITVKLSKMEQLGDGEIKGVISSEYLRRKPVDPDSQQQSKVVPTDGLPDSQFSPEEELTNVHTTHARNILEQHCDYQFGYGATSYSPEKGDLRNAKSPTAGHNGFVCMLSVDEAETLAVLGDMANGRDGLLTAQTQALSIEFLLYNAWADVFAYCVIWFGFQPSGLILKDLEVSPVSLKLLTGVTGIFVMLLQYLVLILNILFLAENLYNLFRSVTTSSKKHSRSHNHEVQTTGGKLAVMCREFGYFYVLEGFNLLDILSCVACLVTWVMFFQFTNSDLASAYFFQEKPNWIQGKCDANNFKWCSDTEVITKFYEAKDQFKTFARVLAVNTIAIYIRLLRYLKVHPVMKVIFSTLVSGIEDIVWFVVIFFVLLAGYMFMGYIVFGSTFDKFKNEGAAMVGCFEIFLGTFNSDAMAEASLPVMIIYVLTFWFVFKLYVMNMFLAIIDKNYNALDAQRTKDQEEQAALGPPKAAKPNKYLVMIKGLFSNKPKEEDGEAGAGAVAIEDVDADAGTGEAKGDDGGAGDTGGTDPKAVLAIEDTKEEAAKKEETAKEDNVVEMAEEDVKNAHWRLLPEDVKVWSLLEANKIHRDIINLRKEMKVKSSKEEDKEAASTSKADQLAQEYATKIDDWAKVKEIEAATDKADLDKKYLMSLKKVHSDQESLSWYIIKQDAQLKKLEEARNVKEERFCKMVKAANSLITEEGDHGEKPLSITNTR